MATDDWKTQIRLQSNKYLTLHNTLYRIPKTGKPRHVLTTDDTDLVLFAFHKDSFGAHQGITATHEKIKERYYFPKMKQVIEQYIKTCDECQKRGKPTWNKQIIPIKVQTPFHKIGIDIKGPLLVTDSGKWYLIVA